MLDKSRWSSTIVSTLLLLALTACGGTSESPPTAEQPAERERPTPAAPAPAAGTAVADGTAMISGTIRYEGKVPPPRPIKMEADPGCSKKHGTPPNAEFLVLGEGNTMANVLVKVTGGLPEAGYAPPAEPAVLDQEGCLYVPHVVGVMVGQPLKILNSDGLLHNIHALPEVNQSFNQAMPASVTETVKTFTKPEPAFKIKCDVHPWMGAYIEVLSHPFFDVTDSSGRFEIAGLSAGTYQVEAWHEKLGSRTGTVAVADDETASADLTFTR